MPPERMESRQWCMITACVKDKYSVNLIHPLGTYQAFLTDRESKRI